MAYESEEEKRAIDRDVADLSPEMRDLLNLDEKGLRRVMRERRALQQRLDAEGWHGRLGRQTLDMFRRGMAPLQDLKDYFTGPEQMYVDADKLRELQGMFGDIQQPRGYSVMDMMSERHKGGMPFPGGELGQMELELMMGRGLRAPGGDPSQRLVDKMYKKLPRKRGY